MNLQYCHYTTPFPGSRQKYAGMTELRKEMFQLLSWDQPKSPYPLFCGLHIAMQSLFPPHKGLGTVCLDFTVICHLWKACIPSVHFILCHGLLSESVCQFNKAYRIIAWIIYLISDRNPQFTADLWSTFFSSWMWSSTSLDIIIYNWWRNWGINARTILTLLWKVPAE